MGWDSIYEEMNACVGLPLITFYARRLGDDAVGRLLQCSAYASADVTMQSPGLIVAMGAYEALSGVYPVVREENKRAIFERLMKDSGDSRSAYYPPPCWMEAGGVVCVEVEHRTWRLSHVSRLGFGFRVEDPEGPELHISREVQFQAEDGRRWVFNLGHLVAPPFWEPSPYGETTLTFHPDGSITVLDPLLSQAPRPYTFQGGRSSSYQSGSASYPSDSIHLPRGAAEGIANAYHCLEPFLMLRGLVEFKCQPLRAAAIQCLGRVCEGTGNVSVQRHICDLMASSEADARRAAMIALWRIGADAESKRTILECALGDNCYVVRAVAVEVLGLMGPGDDTPALQKALGSEHVPAVVSALKAALGLAA